jgi:hypothetical protein
MKIYILISAILLAPLMSLAQQLELVSPLAPELNETSGLLMSDGRLITHGDSGGAAELYEIDSLTGEISRTVIIANATNTDWEDLARDEDYIYIADIGNNNGNRTDLKIFKLSLENYLDTSLSEVPAQLIEYSYGDQEDFSSAPFNTNFDAEAIISLGDSLYLFTKNWIDNHANIYSLPKIPGTYNAQRVDSLNSDGLVTGADYNPATGRLALCGYGGNQPFLLQIENFENANFSSGDTIRSQLEVPAGYSVQIEGIAFGNSSEIFLSAEDFPFGDAALYRLDGTITNTVEQQVHEWSVNITKAGFLEIDHSAFAKAELFDLTGGRVRSSKSTAINTEGLVKGIYLVVVFDGNGSRVGVKKVFIN